jgi:hypothetical protein
LLDILSLYLKGFSINKYEIVDRKNKIIKRYNLNSLFCVIIPVFLTKINNG